LEDSLVACGAVVMEMLTWLAPALALLNMLAVAEKECVDIIGDGETGAGLRGDRWADMVVRVGRGSFAVPVRAKLHRSQPCHNMNTRTAH
jgi:hypothetical protein